MDESAEVKNEGMKNMKKMNENIIYNEIATQLAVISRVPFIIIKPLSTKINKIKLHTCALQPISNVYTSINIYPLDLKVSLSLMFAFHSPFLANIFIKWRPVSQSRFQHKDPTFPNRINSLSKILLERSKPSFCNMKTTCVKNFKFYV